VRGAKGREIDIDNRVRLLDSSRRLPHLSPPVTVRNLFFTYQPKELSPSRTAIE